MSRERLPDRRQSKTFKIPRFAGLRASYHITAGNYPDDRIGEVFISTNRGGSAMEALARDVAILMSLCLQFGCSISTIRDALTRESNGEPSTIAGAAADAIAKWENGDRHEQTR